MTSRFDFCSTPIAGLFVVVRKPFADSRGSFARFFCAETFREILFKKPIAQINHSFTRCCGAVRGLHFQYPPCAEAKLVSCIRGRVFDVAVDVRAGSPTFLQWHGEEISAANGKALFIPEGFAHGFQTLEDDCELLYLHTENYEPGSEGALNVNDFALNIRWPLKITEISERDRSHPFINKEFAGVQL
ncbi:MAG: dTDP-4-dehydrorhamnose 3,5-epimerase [Candidatus Ozemobacteraceae bacterium]